jgi:hypothetical protein
MMAKKKRGPAGSASLEALEVNAAHVISFQAEIAGVVRMR